jgi:hypothetical protein
MAQKLKLPKTLKQLCLISGPINYYCDMRKQQLHILILFYGNNKVLRGRKLFKWKEARDKAFQEMKKLIS